MDRLVPKDLENQVHHCHLSILQDLELLEVLVDQVALDDRFHRLNPLNQVILKAQVVQELLFCPVLEKEAVNELKF